MHSFDRLNEIVFSTTARVAADLASGLFLKSLYASRPSDAATRTAIATIADMLTAVVANATRTPAHAVHVPVAAARRP